jgi:hypothetical protein
VQALDEPEGFDVVIDATGVVAALEAGADAVRRGGRLMVFGVAPAEATMRLSPFRIYNDEITVLGSMAVLHSFGPALDLMAAGAIDTAAMLSHDFPLDGFGEALGVVRSGGGGEGAGPAAGGLASELRRPGRPPGGNGRMREDGSPRRPGAGLARLRRAPAGVGGGALGAVRRALVAGAPAVPEPDCGLRSPLQRDRDRIVHSKAFRRLKHKTQVFVAPEGDHYRTRLTHTLEVTQIARTVARALALNEDLTEAIGLGHDLGHRRSGTSARRCSTAACASATARLPPLRALAARGDVLERDGAGPQPLRRRRATGSCATRGVRR